MNETVRDGKPRFRRFRRIASNARDVIEIFLSLLPPFEIIARTTRTRLQVGKYRQDRSEQPSTPQGRVLDVYQHAQT